MDQHDYIVVGAGSAGAALAARLSENPNSKVLLIEAGKKSHPYTRFPISFGLLINDPAANWLYESEPEPNTNQRAIPVPRGKVLGGSSAINGLVWVRGQPLDYDTWAQMGARGWSWRDVAPVFDRIEDFESKGLTSRGKGGPLHVQIVPDQNPLYDALFEAASQAGFKINCDYNSRSACETRPPRRRPLRWRRLRAPRPGRHRARRPRGDPVGRGRCLAAASRAFWHR
jgi:choline dehydrogenase